jgi:gamma-butyrobetaine dioxygenase
VTSTARDVSFADVFPPPWLRDNCPCAKCRDVSNHQKLFQMLDLASDVEILSVTERDDEVEVLERT